MATPKFPYILEQILLEIKDCESELRRLRSDILLYDEDIEEDCKHIILGTNRATKKSIEERHKFIEKSKSAVKEIEGVIMDYERYLKYLKNARICVMRLTVIERYIMSNIWQYPLEYIPPVFEKFPTSDYKKGFTFPRIPTNISLSVKIHDKIPFSISVAVPSDCFETEGDNVQWYFFAEVMIKRGDDYYNRKDFGLSQNEDQSDYQDEVFSISGFKEFQIILQRFDTWYGTTLD